MSNLTRRGMLGASAAALAPVTVMPTAAAVPPAHPDAELIALCSELDALERRYLAFYRGGATHIENDAARDAAQASIVEEQEALVPRIYELPPSTREGAVALARSLSLWDAELLKVTPGDYTNQVLTATLVRGLIGGAA